MNLTKNVYLAALMNANSTNQDAVFSSRDRLNQSDCVMQIIINMATRCFAVRVVSGSPSSRMRERTRPAMGRDGASLGKVIGSERLCVMCGSSQLTKNSF